MGFPHCPICVELAFVSAFIGVTRSYMFFILIREFMRAESNSKLKFTFSALNPGPLLTSNKTNLFFSINK